MSFIRTGLREIGLKIRRQRTRMILRHEKRLLQKSEIALGREGTSQAANFPELRNEIEHFFQVYKDLEGKTTVTRGFGNRSDAQGIIAASRERLSAG